MANSTAKFYWRQEQFTLRNRPESLSFGNDYGVANQRDAAEVTTTLLANMGTWIDQKAVFTRPYRNHPMRSGIVNTQHPYLRDPLPICDAISNRRIYIEKLQEFHDAIGANSRVVTTGEYAMVNRKFSHLTIRHSSNHRHTGKPASGVIILENALDPIQ